MEILLNIQRVLKDLDFKYKTLDRNDFSGYVWQDNSWLLINNEKTNKFKKLDYSYRAGIYNIYGLEKLFEKNKKVFAILHFTGKSWEYVDGLQIKFAKSKALKIIPELANMSESGKITKKYIEEHLMELSFLIQSYELDELELLIQKHLLKEELKNF